VRSGRQKRVTPLEDDIENGAQIEAPVKFFNRAKGFGFVTLPDGQDVFFHVSALTAIGQTAVDRAMSSSARSATFRATARSPGSSR
jgi:hypothetical protein